MTDDTNETEQRNSEPEHFEINSRLEISETSRRLISEARRSINVLLYDYDETLLPVADIDHLLSSFIRHHDRCRFQYLCSESSLLRERGGKLIQLARRFSTFIKLRQLPDGLKPVHEQFIVTDNTSCIQTQDQSSYDYYAHLNDRSRAHLLNNRFDELWQRSSPVQGIHVAGL